MCQCANELPHRKRTAIEACLFVLAPEIANGLTCSYCLPVNIEMKYLALIWTFRRKSMILGHLSIRSRWITFTFTKVHWSYDKTMEISNALIYAGLTKRRNNHTHASSDQQRNRNFLFLSKLYFAQCATPSMPFIRIVCCRTSDLEWCWCRVAYNHIQNASRSECEPLYSNVVLIN